MKFEPPRESTWAFRQLMLEAQADINSGERKGATVLWKLAHPRKVLIGRFAARILRMKARA